MAVIRRARSGDLQAVAALQSASPQAAQWPVAQYMQYDFVVATAGGAVAGFAVWRKVAEDECELLNLVVGHEFRRRGVGRRLIAAVLDGACGQVFLEVRESNQAARLFYKSIGFKEVSIRREYYESPLEAAIVMKFHSC